MPKTFTLPAAEPDTRQLTFTASSRKVKYGDNRKFSEYTILTHHKGKVVGIETGPRRQSVTAADAMKAARARIRLLKSHRLFVIHVTKKHIDDGQARNCRTCAISQALFHNQERMGFSKYDFGFEVAPYGAFVDPRGIVLYDKDGDEIARIPNEDLPDICICTRDGRHYREDIPTWAMQFDDWQESRSMSLKEWRSMHGYRDGQRPSRPGPASFVLDLDMMKIDTTEVK